MSETTMRLDILTEIHKVRRKIYEMKPEEREKLMRHAEEIAQVLNQGHIKIAKKKLTESTAR